MSNIPKARSIILDAMAYSDVGPNAYKKLSEAVSLMTRVKSPRPRAPKIKQTITADMKKQIRKLAQSKLSLTEIAEEVGLPPRALGRVSEVLHGKR